jgi:hypothetical protein
MLENAYSPSIYNQLLLVQQADLAVKKSPRFDEFLHRAGELFVANQVNKTVGVFLLHRHNSIDDNTLMLERAGIRNGETVLITGPNPISSGLGVPTRWALTNGSFAPTEFGTDSELGEQLVELKAKADFLSSFANLLVEYKLESYLGLCLFDRDYFHEDRSDMILVEESELDTSSNIVKWVRNFDDKSKLIQTVWHFESPLVAGPGCVPLCKQYCVMYSPGHAIEHYPIHGIIA